MAASFPWKFHPETELVIKYLEENATKTPLSQIPIDLVRAGHFERMRALSVRDDKYDVTRSEIVIPSPYAKGKSV